MAHLRFFSINKTRGACQLELFTLIVLPEKGQSSDLRKFFLKNLEILKNIFFKKKTLEFIDLFLYPWKLLAKASPLEIP